MATNSDFSVGCVHKFTTAFSKAGGDPQDMNALAENEELMKKLIGLMPQKMYRVQVGYEDIPSFADLNKAFPGGVSVLWDAKKYKLEAHESCKNVDEKPGEREFLVRHFGKLMTSNAVIAAADKDGFRPATLKEALAFAAAHPDVQRKFWILALGSFAVNQGGYRNVPNLSMNDGERYLDGRWYDRGWGDEDRFLLVRK